MQSIIDLNNLDYLPYESLMILKDNYGKKEYYSLCIKLKDSLFTARDFKISFIVIDNVPICVLMLKLDKKIYKCLIGFEFEKEFSYLKNLMNSKMFNLFLMTSNKSHEVIKIENVNYKNFIKALSNVKENFIPVSCDTLEIAKNKLLNMYSDEELWKY